MINQSKVNILAVDYMLHVRLDYFIRIPWSRLIRFEREINKIVLACAGCIENIEESKELEIEIGIVTNFVYAVRRYEECSSSILSIVYISSMICMKTYVFRFIYTKNSECVWLVFHSTSFFDGMNVWRINVNLLAYWKMGKPTFNVYIIASL